MLVQHFFGGVYLDVSLLSKIWLAQCWPNVQGALTHSRITPRIIPDHHSGIIRVVSCIHWAGIGMVLGAPAYPGKIDFASRSTQMKKDPYHFWKEPYSFSVATKYIREFCTRRMPVLIQGSPRASTGGGQGGQVPPTFKSGGDIISFVPPTFFDQTHYWKHEKLLCFNNIIHLAWFLLHSALKCLFSMANIQKVPTVPSPPPTPSPRTSSVASLPRSVSPPTFQKLLTPLGLPVATGKEHGAFQEWYRSFFIRVLRTENCTGLIFITDMPLHQGSRWMPARYLHGDAGDNTDDPAAMTPDGPCWDPWMSESPFKKF